MKNLQEISQQHKDEIIKFSHNSLYNIIFTSEALIKIVTIHSLKFKDNESSVINKIESSIIMITNALSYYIEISKNALEKLKGENIELIKDYIVRISPAIAAIKNIKQNINNLLEADLSNQYKEELVTSIVLLKNYLFTQDAKTNTTSLANESDVDITVYLSKITGNIKSLKDEPISSKNLETTSLYLVKQLFVVLSEDLCKLEKVVASDIVDNIIDKIKDDFSDFAEIMLNTCKIGKILPYTISQASNLSIKLGLYKVYQEINKKIKKLDPNNEELEFAKKHSLIKEDLILSTPKFVEDVEESLENAKSTIKSCTAGAKYLWNAMKNIFVSTCCDTVDCCEPDCCTPKCYDPAGCCDHKDHAQIIQHDQPLDVNLTVLTDNPQS